MIHIESKMHDEYNQYRGWQIPENEDSADEGYHVVQLEWIWDMEPAGTII